jgi:large subunit ribosomal protein L18
MSKRTRLPKRRGREHKTDYRKRLVLLKGDFPRLVVRKTNRYIILEIVESVDAQDRVVKSVNSKELLKNGWPKDKEGSLKSIPAAYLSGLLLGKKIGELKEDIILDSGLIPSTKGSRVYAAVKGLLESGVEIRQGEELSPKKEKLEGEGTKIDIETFNKIKNQLK